MTRFPRRLALTALLVAALAAGGLVGLRHVRQKAIAPTCAVSAPDGTFAVGMTEAANATTIAAVGKRIGMPDHAVTVALAAALQESKLQNLDHGDLDSVGLFQQRPSQGWGTQAQLLSPTYAATAFYRALTRVDGWASLSVTDAAQQVQRSAAPNAYAQWEGQARALAEALTGEAAAGLSCRFRVPGHLTAATALADAMSSELGPPGLGQTVTSARGWTMASWLVAHAYDYRISTVTFLGSVWTAAGGRWQPQGPAVSAVEVRAVT